MKIFTLFIALACGSLQLRAQEFSTAIEYNDYIVAQQNSIAAAMLIFNEELSKDTATKESATEKLEGLKSATKTSLANVRKISGYDGNVELRAATIDLFSFYEITFAKEYLQMIDLLYQEVFDESTMAEMQRMLTDISSREGALDEKFSAAQQAFATTHDFELTVNEYQDDLNGE